MNDEKNINNRQTDEITEEKFLKDKKNIINSYSFRKFDKPTDLGEFLLQVMTYITKVNIENKEFLIRYENFKKEITDSLMNDLKEKANELYTKRKVEFKKDKNIITFELDKENKSINLKIRDFNNILIAEKDFSFDDIKEKKDKIETLNKNDENNPWDKSSVISNDENNPWAEKLQDDKENANELEL